MDISSMLAALPDSVQGYAALVIISCGVATVFIKPPAAGSRWVLPYRVVSALALNVGWAANHLPAGHAASSTKDRPSTR